MAKSITKPLFISWCPKDALDGMQALDPWEELAYRRTIDLLYCHDGRLPDDDERMGWLTKVGIKRWKKIKPALVAMGKLTIREAFIEQGRVTQVLAETATYISKQSNRAKTRWDREKGNKNNGGNGAAAYAGTPSRHMHGDMPPQMPDGSGGSAAGYAIHHPISNTSTSTENSTAREAVGDDRISPIADEIWRLAGRTAEADRKRTSGNIDDYRHVRAWVALGFSEEQIMTAARSVIEKAGEIRSLWGLLAKAMPDALHQQTQAVASIGGAPSGPPWRNRYRYVRQGGKWDPKWGAIEDVPANIRAEIDAEFGGAPSAPS